MKSLEQVLIDLFNGDQPNFYQRIDEAVLRVAYVYCERNQLRTARLLGISRNVVRDRLLRYRLVTTQNQ